MDYDYYDSQTTNLNRYTVQTGTATLTYDTNGLTVKGTKNADTYVENTVLTLPTDYSLECTLTARSGPSASTVYYGGLCVDDLLIDFSSANIKFYTLSNLSQISQINEVIQANDVLRFERENGTMKVYINDVLKLTQSVNHNGKIQYRMYMNRSLTVKDLKVLEL